ncbi:MAG: XRE family transcriptional regulator [Spirochaetaceae bacterium]|nr:MAG: XRE family transcriptional regulator [Spirochaetaceae bacterium]
MEPAKPPLIGQNIKRLRKEQQMTLDMLSEKSGVSKAMLSQIEAQKVNPTVATVWKIARGLEVDLDSLLHGGGAPVRKFSVTRSQEVATLDSSDSGPHIRVLSPIEMAEDLEIYLLTFDPGSVLDSEAHAPGTEEYLTVIEGSVSVTVGEKQSTLAPGDFALYNCDVHHTIAHTGSGLARVHMVVRFTRRQWA